MRDRLLYWLSMWVELANALVCIITFTAWIPGWDLRACKWYLDHAEKPAPGRKGRDHDQAD